MNRRDFIALTPALSVFPVASTTADDIEDAEDKYWEAQWLIGLYHEHSETETRPKGQQTR